jgi:hypothetical protein
MRKIEELLLLFKGVENKLQTRWDWTECECFDEIPFEVFDILKPVDSEIDTHSHRWYDTSISVYEVAENEFLGVRSITSSKSESQEAVDCYVYLEFFEMQPIQVTSYKVRE